MPIDFHPSSRHRFLVLYDPAALPADFPIDPDLETPEPNPPAQSAVKALSWEGRGFVIELPQEEDCEATLRVFVNENPSPELLSKANCTIRETLLSLPGGMLRADGSEFMCLPGQKRKDADGEGSRVAPGDYLLTVHELVRWKTENRDRELRFQSNSVARWTDGILSSLGILCAVLIVAHILVVPAALWILWQKHGWKSAGKVGAIILAVDACVYVAILLAAMLQKRFPSVFGFSEVRRKFEDEHPDFIAVLQTAEGRPGSGDTALFTWPGN